MTGRLHVYAWDNLAKVYRHLGSLPAGVIRDEWLVAGRSISLAAATQSDAWPPPRPGQPPEAVYAIILYVEGRITALAGIGLGLVVTADSVPLLPALADWQPRAKPKAATEAPAA